MGYTVGNSRYVPFPRMAIPRTVAPEILDSLSADDPAAIRSRRDLRRIHRVMGTRGIVARALLACGAPCRAATRLRILELGAGDGSLMLDVARQLRWEWPAVQLTLLDRLNLIDAKTIADYAEIGWRTEVVVADALDWAAPHSAARMGESAAPRWDLIVANLFLHHFDAAPLATLFRAISLRANCFFACEPRRGWLSLGASHLVGVIGAAAVTRSDAVASVHAGFCDQELSALWPAKAPHSSLDEYSVGPFSHCFYVERTRHAQVAAV